MDTKTSAVIIGAVVAAAAIVTLAVKPNTHGCRARPAGVEVARCSKVCGLDPDGKQRKGICDPGTDNVMGEGQWVDHGGCVEVACVQVWR